VWRGGWTRVTGEGVNEWARTCESCILVAARPMVKMASGQKGVCVHIYIRADAKEVRGQTSETVTCGEGGNSGARRGGQLRGRPSHQ